MSDVYLLTGGNIGNRLQNLQQAAKLVGERLGAVSNRSSVYETAAWGLTAQPAFLNQVLQIRIDTKPEEALQVILGIEREMGRIRGERMGPRLIDIDLLFFGDQVVEKPELSIPHPRIAARRFVLVPLNEIAPGFIHPVLKRTINELLTICPDPLEVRLFQPPF